MIHSRPLPRWVVAALTALWLTSGTPIASAQGGSWVGVVFEPSVLFGVTYWRERAEYFPGDPNFDEGHDVDRNTYTGPGGELGLMLGARLGEHVQLGGYARLGYAGRAHVFTGAVERTSVWNLGGQLTISQRAHDGFYALGRLGRVFIDEEAGWSASAGIGYGFRCKGAWYLGLGIESMVARVSARWEGDHGHYDHQPFLITNGLAMRLRYRDH